MLKILLLIAGIGGENAADLGHEDFDRRESASRAFERRGRRAVPAALLLQWSEDPEVSRRADSIASRLFPDRISVYDVFLTLRFLDGAAPTPQEKARLVTLAEDQRFRYTVRDVLVARGNLPEGCEICWESPGMRSLGVDYISYQCFANRNSGFYSADVNGGIKQYDKENKEWKMVKNPQWPSRQ